MQVYSCTIRVMSTIGTRRVYWELCLIEHIVYLHLGHIFSTNVTVWFSRLKYPKHLVNSTIKSFVDLKVCHQQQQKQIWLLSVRNAFYKSWSQISTCNQTQLVRKYNKNIIFAPSYVNSSRQNRFKCCNLHDLIHIFLNNGVMTTPKGRILSFVFIVLCFKNLF